MTCGFKKSHDNGLGLAEATACSAKGAMQALENKPPDANKQNAERDCERLFTRMGYSLPVPIQSMDHIDGTSDIIRLTTYHVKPQDWVQYWMDTDPKILGGGSSGTAGANFSAFWTLYRQRHPDHDVYKYHGHRLHQVIPLAVHGDEGRAVKRTNFMVASIESILGSTPDDSLSCSCENDLKKRPTIPSYEPDTALPAIDPHVLQTARAQLTNYKGHSYLSRWLIFGVGGWVYKKHPHIIDALFDELVKNMNDLFHNGVKLANNEMCFAACVGVKGDMDFHAKIMQLNRCYSNVGTKNRNRICHLCLAGDPMFDFEDFAETPGWLTTTSRLRPWDTNSPPSLSKLMFDERAPETMLRNDSFHIFKLGLGRDVVGGCLVMLLRLGFFDHANSSSNLDDRLKRSHSMFSLWCRANSKSPGLRSFSKAFFNIKTLTLSAPWANSKGSDTVLLLRWLLFTVRLELSHPTVQGHDRLLDCMQQVIEAGLGLAIMNRHGLWLERPCARLLYAHIMTLLRGYSVLGQQALALHMRAFIQKPKGHALHHLGMDLKQQLKTGCKLILSPQAWACEINEDYLGRISRLSRRVGFRLCEKRVIQRYFLKISALCRKRKEGKQQTHKKKKR